MTSQEAQKAAASTMDDSDKAMQPFSFAGIIGC